MGISNYNPTKNITWNINTDGFKYIKLSELEPDTAYDLYGMFVTSDHGYGEGAVLIMNDCLVNIPERYVNTIKAMINDPEVVQLIKAGKTAFAYHEFTSKKYHRTGYAVEFIDN